MNKRNLLCGFALCMTGLLALGSCGPRLSEEEGMQALQNIKDTYKTQKIEKPTKFSFKYEENIISKDEEISEYKLIMLAELDLDNAIFHLYNEKKEMSDDHSICKEAWLYYEDYHTYLVSNEPSKGKIYIKEASSLEKAKKIILSNSDISFVVDQLSCLSTTYADDINEFAYKYGEEHIHENMPGDAITKSKSVFKSNGDGSFIHTFNAKIKEGVDMFTDLIADIELHAEVEIENYYLQHYFINQFSDTCLGCKITNKKGIDVSYEVNITKPDLSEYNIIH